MPPLAALDCLRDDLSRLRFLIATAAAGLLTSCGHSATSGSPTAAGRWTFTDDRGVTVSRDARPERIVTYETAGSTRSGPGREA